MRDVYVLTTTLPCSYKRMAKVKAGLSGCVAWSAVCSLVARLGYGEEGAQSSIVPAMMMGGGFVVVFVRCGVWVWFGKKAAMEGKEGQLSMVQWEKIVREVKKKRDMKKERKIGSTKERQFESNRRHMEGEGLEKGGVEMIKVVVGGERGQREGAQEAKEEIEK